jgi:predicted dehydrogenase
VPDGGTTGLGLGLGLGHGTVLSRDNVPLKKRTMRVALLGFGKVAESTHVPGFLRAPGRPWDIAAVAEPSPERRAVAAQVLPHARVYASAEELLARERDIDVADVVAPPFLHARLVRASLGAGLHVLCEKPLSLDVAEVETLGREAAARDRVLYTMNNWRWAPLVDAALIYARSGELGAIRFFGWSVRRKAADPGAAPGGKTWREDPALALGGVLVDHGWHAFTVVHALLGSGPRRVSARLEDEPGRGDTEARVRIEQGAARVFVRLTWRAKRRANRARIVGDRAALTLEDDRIVRPGLPDIVFPEMLSLGSTHPDWFPPVLGAFEEEIERRVPRGTSVAEALSCASTTQAAYASAKRGGEIVELS